MAETGGRNRHLGHRSCRSRLRRHARSAGLFGARVEAADELEGALRAAFEYDGPALVDVHTARHELALPPKLTYGEIKGFTLYATRTILSGDAHELIELAKTNLKELEIE
jgi:pyruvate dehydrogenase (quinone)